MNRVRPESVIIAGGMVIIALVAVRNFYLLTLFEPSVLASAATDDALMQAIANGRDLLVTSGWVLLLLVLAIFVGLALMSIRQRRIRDEQNAALERKIQERSEQLRAQEAQYRRIVETAHEGILMADANNVISYVNPQTSRILGYPAQELIGSPIFMLIPPREQAAAVEGLQSAGAPTGEGEYPIRRKSGEEGWVFWSATPYLDESGALAGSLFLFSDITERKRAQSALKANEELYRSLIDVMPLCVFRKNTDGRITFGNARFWDSIGLAPEDGLGKTDYDISPTELADKYRKDDLAVMASGETIEIVEGFQPLTGERQTIRVIKSPFRDPQGNIQGVQVMFWDITEGRRQSELLRERQELLSRILDTVEDGIYIVDVDGRMTFANKAMERILGVSHDEIVTATYNDVRWQTETYDGKPFPEEEEPFTRIMATGEPVHDVQETILRGDGARVIVSINAAPLHDAAGKLIGEVASMTDITARRKAQEKLLESQQMLAKAQHIAQIGSWRWDMMRDSIEISEEMYRIAGTEPNDFPESTAKFIESMIHPDDRERVAENNMRALQGIAAPLEYRILRPNGQERVVWAEGEITRDANGIPVAMVGVVQDITERKRADAVVWRQTKYLDALHETTLSLMGHLQLDELLQTITQRAATLAGAPHGYIYLVGHNPEDMEMRVGVGLFESMVGTKSERGKGATGTVWETGQVLVIDDYQEWSGRLSKTPGAKLLRSLLSVPLKSQDDVVGVFGLAHAREGIKFDETAVEILTRFGHLASIAIKNAQLYDAAQQEIEERKRAEVKFRSLFDASPDAIVLIDPNQPHWPIVDCNQVTCDMNGYARHELIGQSIDILNTSEGTPEERLEYMEQVRQQGVLRVEAAHRHKDGHLFMIETSTCIIRLGDSELVLGIDRDITKRKEVDRMKTEFISTVSHELRTPLTSIRGSLGLISGGIAGQLPERAKSMVDIAYKNSERLVRLINDILDVEKIESGKMVFQIKPLELMPLIEQAIEANKAYGEQYQVSYQLEPAPDNLKVDADADRITQVVTNLLSNAAKFSPPRSTVEVSAKRAGNMIRVAVRDHGSGISDEFKGRIFEKFAQADSSDTRQKGGTGLGLSIVKAIVEKHGGTIGFETAVGQGTEFYFQLPAHRESEVVEPRDAHAKTRILVVEDDRDVALLLRMMLSQAGFAADLAYDRAQAIEMLRKEKYAVLTLDLLLPDEDGIGFIRELRSSPETRALPIVVVSAKAEQGALQLNGDAVWVADWLQKPIDQQKLVQALQHAMRDGRSHKARILHVEDDPDVRQVVQAILVEKAEVIPADSLAAARQLLEHGTFDLVLLDEVLPDGSGMDLLSALRRGGSQIPIVIFSALENDAEIAGQVSAALVKARTTNEQLLETIQQLIHVPSGGVI